MHNWNIYYFCSVHIYRGQSYMYKLSFLRADLSFNFQMLLIKSPGLLILYFRSVIMYWIKLRYVKVDYKVLFNV